MMSIHEEIERFLKQTGMAPSRFGREALNAKNLVKRLRAGSDVTTRTADKLRAFMTNYQASTDDARSSSPEARRSVKADPAGCGDGFDPAGSASRADEGAARGI